MDEIEQAWQLCETCEGDGKIKNLLYDPDHSCMDGDDCECRDGVDFFFCNPCDGEGWVEIFND
jgi:hypothetical protein